MAKHMHAEGYFYGLLLLLWMGSIFYLSGQPGGVSESLSQGISHMLTDKIASWCGLELDVRLWHFWLRKAAHAFLYVMLAVWCALFLYKSRHLTGWRLLVSVIVVSFLYAVSDELHQAWVPGRSAELRDIVIDTVAAALGAVVWRHIYFRQRQT